MAEFEVIQEEGTRFIKATLHNETIKAEAGALNYHTGKIVLDAKVPSPMNLVRSLLSSEAAVRPTYTGTGEVLLEASLGGFHVIDVDGEPWILEKGTYWCSEQSVLLTWFRERFLTAYWSGEGFIEFLTLARGRGKLVVTCRGPVEVKELNNEALISEGRAVIARTSGVSCTMRRATKSFLGVFLAKEPYVRVYKGTGKLLVSTTPYWRLKMAADDTQALA